MDPSPQLNFSQSPVHTDDYYADVIDRMIAGGAAHTIILGDEAGVLGPERARRWIRQSQERASAGDTPLEMHFHNRTAMANLNHIIGVEEGVHIVHSAISTLANGVSMPSTEVTVDNLRRLGYEVAVDDKDFAAEAMKVIEFVPDYPTGPDMSTTVRAMLHATPEMRAFINDYTRNVPKR